MGDTDVLALEVTTAELASMSSDALRQAVSRGRRADEYEKELGLVRTMNRMLMDSMAELKAQLAQEKEKRSNAGVAHENGRLEENPEDDELPKLRLANESLLTRQLMLEAQVAEAARYSDVVSSDLMQAQKELRAFKDSSQRAEEKCQLLQEELDLLQSSAGIMSLKSSNAHAGGHKASAGAISKLEEENRDLSEKCHLLEEKCAKRKEEVKTLRTNATYLKSKITELISRIQKSDAVNDAALQRLRDQIASEASPTSPLSSSSSETIKPEPASAICGIPDIEQPELLAHAASEIETLRNAENGISLRAYIYERLEAIESMKTNKPKANLLATPQPTSASTPLITVSESGDPSPSSSNGASFSAALSSPPSSVGSPSLTSSNGISGQHAPSNSSGQVNWHEYDAAFLVLSVSLLQKLTTTQESLNRKRRELLDLQEDFNEFKSRAQVTPRSTGGSRKMSMETQQITLQKKLTDLEKTVNNLTAASNDKEAKLSAAKLELTTLASKVDDTTAALEKVTRELGEKKAELEKALTEEQRLQVEIAVQQEKAKELTGALEAQVSIGQVLEKDLSATKISLAEAKEETTRQVTLLENQRAESQQLSDQLKERISKISDLESRLEKASSEIEEKARKIVILETDAKQSNDELLQLKSDGIQKETLLKQRESDLEATRAELETNKREIQNLIENQDRLSSELKQLRDDKTTTETQLDQLQEQLGTSQSDLENARREIQDLNKSLEQLNAEVKRLSDEGGDKSDQLKRKEEQISTISLSLETARQEIQVLSASQDRLNGEVSRLTESGNEKEALLKQRGEQLESTSSALETAKQEIQNSVAAQSVLEQTLSETKKALEAQNEELKSTKASLDAEIQKQKTELTNMASENSLHISTIATLRSEAQDLADQISNLESVQRRLEGEVQMKEQEAREQVRNLTSELLQVKASKDSEIEQLQTSLKQATKELADTASNLEATKKDLETTSLELADKRAALELTQTQLDGVRKSMSALSSSFEFTKSELSSKSEQLESTKSSLEISSAEVVKLNTSLSAMAVAEASAQKEIVHLQMKARELEVLQKKQPEIADEALEAEERAVAKWLEHALTKEKAVSSSNPIAVLASQLSLGNSPGSLAAKHQQSQDGSSISGAGGGASAGLGARKFARLGDSFKSPAFVATVINLAKKDAVAELTVAKYEEAEREGALPESDALRSLEQCVLAARAAGLKISGVSAPLLYQGNRRTIVDFSLEVIRIHAMARTNVRSHPELNMLWPGKDESKLDAKSPDRVLIKWVNTWVEDYNNSQALAALPPRPLVTNLGKDLSDGKVLGIVMAGINPDWNALGDPNAIDLVRKIVTSLQQAVWMRLIPPFLDSHLPILRGEEAILSILLAHLLEWNTGLSSPLAKLPVVQTASSTASMLANTHTPMRHQARAVSGSNMLDSPAKTPAKAVSAIGGSSHSFSTKKAGHDLSSSSKSEYEVTVKPVEETKRWGFW